MCGGQGLEATATMLQLMKGQTMPSTAEKRKIIRKALIAEPRFSNRAIATRLGVDSKTVATVRRAMEDSEEFLTKSFRPCAVED
jgi:hypothetical protein